MFRKLLFILAHQVGNRNFHPTYKRVVKNQWKSYEELKEEQEEQLRYTINFAYNNVLYYHKLFDDPNLNTDDIEKVEDLEKLPVLRKETMKRNWEDFKPINLNKMKYYEQATGGSTGTPFKYRLSKVDRFLSGALLYRGWGSIQKEAYILKVPCITVRENTEWLETVEDRWNALVGANKEKIVNMVKEFEPSLERHKEGFGDGDASKKIVFRICER